MMDTDDASDLLVRWLKAREYAYTLGVALQLVYDEQIAENGGSGHRSMPTRFTRRFWTR